jgi:hypothetical protein
MLEFFHLTDPKTLHPAQLLPVAFRAWLAREGSADKQSLHTHESMSGVQASVSGTCCTELMKECREAVRQVVKEECPDQDSRVADALEAFITCDEVPGGDAWNRSAVNVCLSLWHP